MAAYKFGGGLGQFGGKAVTYGAALQVATAPGYLTPFTAPAAAAGTAAGALSETIGGEAAFGGTTIQVVAGTVIYLQTGDWVPLYASGAPALASALSPLNGLFGPSLEDRLQSYLESRSPTLRNCGG
jgi:hypothetical protein